MSTHLEAMTSDMVLLAKVAEAGSISGASRSTGLERSTVSRRIGRLEKRLGVFLLDRSGREVRLTDLGQIYCRFCQRIVETAEDAEATIRDSEVKPTGVLRVRLAIPEPAGLIEDATRQFGYVAPGLRIHYLLADQQDDSDVVADFALQLGMDAHRKHELIGLTPVPQSFWTTHDYLDRFRFDGKIDSLSQLDWIDSTHNGLAIRWQIDRGSDRRRFEIYPRYSVSDLEQARNACLKGLGVALLPDYLCKEYAASGHLLRVLPDWQPPATVLCARRPSNALLNRGARAFIDFLRKQKF